MTMNDDHKIAELDLSGIKLKLMHESGEYWSQERTDAVEIEYRRFLYLAKKYPTHQAAPTVDVDTFWHSHILDTRKYAGDCQEVFGYFLHHYPYLGMGGAESHEERRHAAELMRSMYEETFGESYPGAGVDDENAQAGSAPAYCTFIPNDRLAEFANKHAAYCTRAMQAGAGTDYAHGTPEAAAIRTQGATSAYCTRPAEPARAAGTQPAYCTRAGEPGLTGKHAAYCTFTAEQARAGNRAAYCTFPSGPAHAAGDQAAYCTVPVPSGPAVAAGDRTAYCTLPGAPKAEANTRTAYCTFPAEPAHVAGNRAAYCTLPAAPARAAGNQPAYCTLPPGPARSAGSQPAYCTLPPGPARSAGNQTAYCTRAAEPARSDGGEVAHHARSAKAAQTVEKRTLPASAASEFRGTHTAYCTLGQGSDAPRRGAEPAYCTLSSDFDWADENLTESRPRVAMH